MSSNIGHLERVWMPPGLFRGLRVLPSGEEVQRVERVIAIGRVFIAVTACCIWLMTPVAALAETLARVLLLGYLLESLVVLTLVRARQRSTPEFRLAVHAVDLVWAAAATMIVNESSGLFLLFLVFTLVAAAYRWGIRGTIGTALWAIPCLSAGHALLMQSTGEPLGDAHQLAMQSACLLVFSLLLGYLAEEDKQLRSESVMSSRLLARVQEQRTLGDTLTVVAAELRALFGARGVVFVLQAADEQPAFIWSRGSTHPDLLETDIARPQELAAAERDIYAFTPLGHVWYAVSRPAPRGDGWQVHASGGPDRRADRFRTDLPGGFLRRHPCQALLSVALGFPDEWTARVFLLDPQHPGIRSAGPNILLALVRQVAPAIYNVYLMRRLRARAGAIERARVSRELHDGVIQSLVGLEMRLQVAKLQARDRPAHAQDLGEMQKTLRDEILNLRELMQQMRPADVSPRELLDYLAGFVERFERETGIAARFVSELQEVRLSARACREVARIVQEAMVNVRKHSRARNVVVRLSRDTDGTRLLVDDDGAGFAFEGRLSQSDLDFARKGPIVIKERVRALGGRVTIESNPGRGSRLDIVLPLN
jgi:signal transduction histidine kinase